MPNQQKPDPQPADDAKKPMPREEPEIGIEDDIPSDDGSQPEPPADDIAG